MAEDREPARRSEYVPTADQFAEGGYEVEGAFPFYGQPGPFIPEVEDRVLATARRLLELVLT